MLSNRLKQTVVTIMRSWLREPTKEAQQMALHDETLTFEFWDNLKAELYSIHDLDRYVQHTNKLPERGDKTFDPTTYMWTSAEHVSSKSSLTTTPSVCTD